MQPTQPFSMYLSCFFISLVLNNVLHYKIVFPVLNWNISFLRVVLHSWLYPQHLLQMINSIVTYQLFIELMPTWLTELSYARPQGLGEVQMWNRPWDNPDKHNFYLSCLVWRVSICGLKMIDTQTFLFIIITKFSTGINSYVKPKKWELKRETWVILSAKRFKSKK